jgi:DNA-binding beta-propeller fold protein YncE
MDSEVIYRSGDFSFRLLFKWAKFAPEQRVKIICGIAQATDGLIYVATRSSVYPIAVFDTDGNFIRGFGEDIHFRRTHGIWADSDGTLWCCDDQSNLVYHLDTWGKVLHTMGTKDEFCDNGYDPTVTWPHDLYTITRAGEPFNRPTKVIRAPNGCIYTADGYGNTAIHCFDKNFKLIKTWGGPGREEGKFRLPHAIWADPQNRIWVTDRENDRVQIFDEDGSFIKLFDRLEWPSEIWGNEKNIYISEARSGVVIYDMNMKQVARIGYPGSPIGAHGLGGDSEGNLYLGCLGGTYPLMKLERI